MKKIKFKRKSKRIFLNTTFISIMTTIIIISMSFAYSLLSQNLNIVGTASGQTVYTYYFEKPDSWRGNYMHAHIWNDGGSNIGTQWPGLSMEKVTETIYKVTVTSDMSFYADHNFIIFDDMPNNSSSGSQTSNIPLNRLTNNNQLFRLKSYESNQYIRIFVKTPTDWTTDGKKLYVYMWNSTTGENNAPWPGVDITANQMSADGYYVLADHTKYDKIIFNSNGTIQTADLTIPSKQDQTYEAGHARWSEYYQSGIWSDYIESETLTPSHSH